MSRLRTFRVTFWEERGGSFEIQARRLRHAERIAKQWIDNRDFDEFEIDWYQGNSGVFSVEAVEGGAP